MPSFLETFWGLKPSCRLSAYSQIVFFDDFSDLSLRTGGPAEEGYAAGSGTWTPRHQFSPDEPRGSTLGGEKAWMADPAYEWAGGWSPFSIEGSCLRIRMERASDALREQLPDDPDTGFPFDYVTGGISTRHSFEVPAECLIEARIKLPTAARGLWPAFWLYATDAPHREIDIFEWWGSDPDFVFTSQHWNWPLEHEVWYTNMGFDVSRTFHVFALERAAARLLFYLDGKLIRNIAQKPAIAGATMPIIINLAGGGWRGLPDETTPDNNEMLVDWVRVSTAV